MTTTKRRTHALCASEMEYINKFLLRYGRMTVYKHRNMPELILNAYELILTEQCKDYQHNTSEQRLKVINDYIDYILHIEPAYKKFLRLHNLKGWQFGMMFGYKNTITWHKSYKRYTYIRAVITLINKHEEMLTRMNDPK